MSSNKDISGAFISSEKWNDVILAFRNSSCSTTNLRLYHNTAKQTAELLGVVGSSVTNLYLGQLHSDSLAQGALQQFLSNTHCQVQTLTIQQLDDGGDALGSGLCNNKSVTALHLANCSSPDGLHQLSVSFTNRHASLVDLSFKRCRFGNNAAALGTLIASGRVEHLTAHECALTDQSLNMILQDRRDTVPKTQSGIVSLQSLDFSRNQLKAGAGHFFSQHLYVIAPSLQDLVLEGNTGLGDTGAEHIAQGLSCGLMPTTIRHLDLRSCGINAAGCSALSLALSSTSASVTNLKRLNLSGNVIGAQGLVELLSALARGHCFLHELSLNDCRINGNELANVCIPQAETIMPFSAPIALRTLCLASNTLGDNGISWLLKALSCFRSLQELDVGNGHIGDAGAQHLVSLLSQHPQLSILSCYHNEVHDHAAQKLCSAAVQHPGLRKFKAEEMRVSDLGLRVRISEASKTISARPAHKETERPTQQDLGPPLFPPVTEQPPVSPVTPAAVTALSTGGSVQHHKHQLDRVPSITEQLHVAKHVHVEAVTALEPREHSLCPWSSCPSQGEEMETIPISKSYLDGLPKIRAANMDVRTDTSADPMDLSTETRAVPTDVFTGDETSLTTSMSDLSRVTAAGDDHLNMKSPDSCFSNRSSENTLMKTTSAEHMHSDVQMETSSDQPSCNRSWNAVTQYSRRFRPLSVEQQALFSNF